MKIETKTYRVKRQKWFDGTLYGPDSPNGDILPPLTKEQAALDLANGTIEEVKEEPKADVAPPAPRRGEARKVEAADSKDDR